MWSDCWEKSKCYKWGATLDFQIQLLCIFLEHWTTENFNNTIFGLKVYIFLMKSCKVSCCFPRKDCPNRLSFSISHTIKSLVKKISSARCKISPAGQDCQNAFLENFQFLNHSPLLLWKKTTNLFIFIPLQYALRRKDTNKVRLIYYETTKTTDIGTSWSVHISATSLTFLLNSVAKISYLMGMSLALLLFLFTTHKVNLASTGHTYTSRLQLFKMTFTMRVAVFLFGFVQFQHFFSAYFVALPVILTIKMKSLTSKLNHWQVN